MVGTPIALVYTWQHRESNNSAVPIHARAVKGGVVLQYLDGTVRVYRRADSGSTLSSSATTTNQSIDEKAKFTLVTTIIGSGFSKSRNNNGIIEVSKYDTPLGEREAVFVSGGMRGESIRKYDVPSGRLLAHSTLPFECRGLNAHLNKRVLLAWGYSCEMVALDQITLKIIGRWTSLPDWPLPTSLFEDRVLVFFKSGMASHWKVFTDKGEHESVQQIGHAHPMIRLPPPPSPKLFHDNDSADDNDDDLPAEFVPKFIKSRKQSVVTMFDKSHGFDPLITVKQVSAHLWVVARRHGWMLYKWEDGTLVDEISADVTEGIISIIIASDFEDPQDQTFGILTKANRIIWVSHGTVQVIEPTWNVKNDEIIACAVYSKEDNALNAFVVTEHGIDVYQAPTKGSNVMAWDPVPFRLQTFKKTTEYVSGVSANGDKVVIGRGNELLLYSPENFLNSEEDQGQLLYTLSDNHRVTTVESVQETRDDIVECFVAAGTSDGRFIEVNAETSEVRFCLEIFATPLTRIIWLTSSQSPLYENFILAISLNSEVALIDRVSRTLWKQIPGNDLNITSISFTSQNPCWIVIEYEDKQRKIWDLDTDEEVDDMTFFASLAPKPGTVSDKASLSSFGSGRRSTINQAEVEKHLQNLDNILLSGNNVKPESGLLLTPPSYTRAPLMIIRADLLVHKFVKALDSGDDEAAERLSLTAKALCLSMFHLPCDQNSSDKARVFHDFLHDIFSHIDEGYNEMGVGLLSHVGRSMDLSLFSVKRKVPTTMLEIDSETTSRVLTMWISLVQLLARYKKVEAPSVSEIFDIINTFDKIKKPNIIGLAKPIILQTGLLHDNAQLLVHEIIKHADIDQIIKTWKPFFLKKSESHGEFTQYSMLVLSLLTLYLNQKQSSNSTDPLARDIAHRLGEYLDDAALNENTRILAIQLIGQGWGLWQKYVNPFGILQSLIDLLYENGFVSGTEQLPQLSGALLAKREEFVQQCRASIKEIAIQNSTLLVSVLSIYIRSPEHIIDARIAALRLLKSFLTTTASSSSGESTPALITEVHLPTIVSNVVHLLEPANASTREVSETGGVSLVTEVTQFLARALGQYPSSLAFHKIQQRLAVSLTAGGLGAHDETHMHQYHVGDNAVLAFVYDLRTGSAIAALSVRSHERSSGIVHLSNLAFSPDGKSITGIMGEPVSSSDSATNSTDTSGHNSLVIWKIGFGFMSLIHNLSLKAGSSSGSTAGSTAVSSTAGSPTGMSLSSTPNSTVLEDQTAISRLTVYPRSIKPIGALYGPVTWENDKEVVITDNGTPHQVSL